MDHEFGRFEVRQHVVGRRPVFQSSPRPSFARKPAVLRLAKPSQKARNGGRSRFASSGLPVCEGHRSPPARGAALVDWALKEHRGIRVLYGLARHLVCGRSTNLRETCCHACVRLRAVAQAQQEAAEDACNGRAKPVTMEDSAWTKQNQQAGSIWGGLCAGCTPGLRQIS